jgi:putative peptidoglycan lipid II flippase
LAGWLEFALLRRGLNRRIGATGLPSSFLLTLWGAALLAAATGFGASRLAPALPPIPAAALALAPFGLTYLLLTTLAGLPEARALTGRLLRRRGPA